MNDFISTHWQQFMALLGAIIWGVRLESRANTNTRDLARLEQRLADQRREDMEARARDWGRMEHAIDEMRRDIKKLLERGAA